MSEKINERPDLGRRGLLTGAFLTKQGRAGVKQLQQHLQQPLGMRPPWHQQVMQSCGLCEQECVSACSQHIIRIHPDEHEHAGTPWLDFSSTGCTFCEDCAVACPAIKSYNKTSAMSGRLQLAKNSCLAWNNVFCMSCVGQCVAGALQLDGQRKLQVNDSLCTACGMCVHACPVNAIGVSS